MLTYDAWLSDRLAKPAYHLTGAAGNLSLPDLPAGDIFVDAKISVANLSELWHLQQMGFRLVDTSLQLVRPAAGCEVAVDGIRFARPDDAAAVKALARTAFQHHRFYNDPDISRDNASRIKEAWAGNFFLGQRGRWMVVADGPTGMAGFLQLLPDQEERLIIDLIAVAATRRGQGLGRAMTAFAAARCLERPAAMKVGTQIANTTALTFYSRLGFQVTSAAYVLHLHHKAQST